MISHTQILEKISTEGLVEQLRKGNLSAFEKLDLAFDELYAAKEEEDWDLLCNISCPQGGNCATGGTTSD
jgi:hypothetical protein